MKIHIIGCSGTGKTYLARGLSEKYHIPHFDLDDLQWDSSSDSYGVKRPAWKRNELLQEILQNEDWIIEGVYYGWVQESFEKADVIYVLTTPKHIYKYRIIKRFLKRKMGMEKGKKETLKSLCDLLKWTDTFQYQNMKEIKEILKQYESKVIYLSGGKDVRKLIEAQNITK